MTTLEQVEKLREKANVSFEEAKAALEDCDGDLLDAVIYLERMGRVSGPEEGTGYYNSGETALVETETANKKGKSGARQGESFGDMLRRFGRFCLKVLNIGNTNFLEAQRNGNHIFSCPVTVVVILVLFLFWVTIPLFILSLFFGFRYHFSGREMGKESVNKVMGGATDTAESIKKSFAGENGGNK